MLHKNYESKYSVEKNAGRESQGACRQTAVRKVTLNSDKLF
jgi:hypothetical protein